MKVGRLVLLPLLLGLMGCQSTQYTAFAPVEARIEPVPGGGAKYFLLINTSGQTLHNVSLSAYLWNENNQNFFRKHEPIRHYAGSGATWLPGQSQRFRPWNMQVEDPIHEPVTKVEVVGQCDEGRFRQVWVGTESGQLQPVGAKVAIRQSPEYTAFGPVNAWLEPGHGGVHYLVLVNASGRDLHNYKFLVHLWELSPAEMNGQCSGTNWTAGAELRAWDWDHGRQIEAPITNKVAGLELNGRCDEGYFRQGWLADPSGHLQMVEPKPQSAQQ